MKDFKNKTLYTAVQSGNRIELFIKNHSKDNLAVINIKCVCVKRLH